MFMGRPTWAEIDLSAVWKNMLGIKSLLKSGTKFCAVIKADGYGHGAVEMARVAKSVGADYLAVAILDEAIALRKAGFECPILILGYTPEYQYGEVATHRLTQAIFNLTQAEALSAAGSAAGLRVKAHIKVDSGMGRLGVNPSETADFALKVASLSGLEFEGIFTHFATADSADKTHTRKQFEVFMSALADVEERGLRIPIRHCANSAATLDLPEMHLDMVRTGVILYGLWPSTEVTHPIELYPAMRFKTRVAQLKEVPAATCLSYGCTFITDKPSRIATLPVGYADGWPRSLTGKAQIVVAGKRAPLAGRVCMDQCIADVSGVPGVEEGSEVLLFGSPELSADEVAAHLGTINYEIVCMVGKRVPRVYVGE